MSTPMTSFRRSNFWIADAVQFTCSAVATIGIKKFTYMAVFHMKFRFVVSNLIACAMTVCNAPSLASPPLPHPQVGWVGK